MGLRRLFVGVGLTDDARHAIAALLDAVAVPGRAVPPFRWHLTLRFVGEVDQIRAERITASLDQADLGAMFSVTWGGLGAFPRPRRANVLWVGVDGGASRLIGLASAADAAVEGAGLPPSDRPFRPHLTLSRIRPPEDVAAIIAAIGDIGVPMEVRSVSLFETHWERGGPRYEVMEEFPLA